MTEVTYTNSDGRERCYEIIPLAGMKSSEKRGLVQDGYLVVSLRQAIRFDEMGGAEFEKTFAYELAAAASVGIQEPFLVRFQE